MARRSRRTKRKKYARPHRILVVDDEPDLERLVRMRMRRDIHSGRFDLDFAHNGVEALEFLSSDKSYDVILTDINMPRMDGLTLLEQIPGVDPDVRAVVVSAYGDMQNIRTAMNRGAFDFVTKPIDFKDLRLTIDRTLKNLEVWREALKSRDQLVAIENELNVARRMQRSILPRSFPESARYEVYANMRPARAVAGDFYDVVGLERDSVGLAIADVSGKGVPAALFMMSSRTLMKGAAIGGADPGGILGSVNTVLAEENAELMFVTMLYAIFDSRTGALVYANGGHDAPIVLHSDGTTSVLPLTGGLSLGVVPDYQYDCRTARLAEGDIVLLYTDGVTEAQNDRAEQFGEDRIRQTLEGARPGNAKEAIDVVFTAITEFSGTVPQFDDVTCVALRRLG